MIGEHAFPLDCYYLSPTSRAFGTEIRVQYDVSVYLDDDGQVDADAITPVMYSITVGGKLVEEDAKFAECHGALKANILLWSETLGLEQLGITDLEARECIVGEDDWAAEVREHARGRV